MNASSSVSGSIKDAADALSATIDAGLDKTAASADAGLDETAADVASASSHADEARSSNRARTTDPNRYSIRGEIARGGLGRILEAEDRTLGRRVAIKELRVSGRGHARFQREALVTARLQHPSIVPLYDVGRWDSGEPYYSMRLVSGQPLDAAIGARKTLDERLALLPHVIAVADAIAYAHEQRIIHRDLKPANVIVGEFGETVVIDWGLAKDLAANDRDEEDLPEEGPVGPYRSIEAPAPLTQAGEVLGTPVYMAPEQAMGQDLDERADVYAIGAILYELLSGVWPHRGASSAQVIERLVAGEPVTPIQEQQAGVPPELATIVGKAMQHDRMARYRTAKELASELRRFQTGQIVAAHRYSRTMLVRRWIKRHRAAVAIATALGLVLAITIAISVRGIVHERNATRAERDRLILTQASGELERDPTAAIAWLKTYPATGAEPERRREIAMQAQARGVALHVFPRAPLADSGKFSPDGRHYAQPGATTIQVLELATGKRFTLPHGAQALRWSPDSTQLLLASTTLPRRATLVDLAGNTRPLVGEIDPIWRAEMFSPDGSVVMTMPARKLARYSRDGGEGTPEWTPFAMSSYTRRGERFATLSKEHGLVWWDAKERVPHTLRPPEGVALYDTHFAAYALLGDQRIAAGTTDGRLCVWTLPAGEVVVIGQPTGEAIGSVLASHDGNTLVTVGEKYQLRGWRLDEGRERMLPALGTVGSVTMANSGRFAAAALHDRRVVLIDPLSGAVRTVGSHGAAVKRVGISSDERWVATEGDDATARLWRVPEPRFERAGERVVNVATLALAGPRIAAAGIGAMIWDGEREIPLKGHTGPVWTLGFSGDGRLLATASVDQTIRTWDVTSGTETGVPLDAQGGAIFSLVVTRDGGRIASAHASGDVRLWDLATRTSRVLARVPGVRSVALSPDERVVAIGDTGGVQLVPIDGGPARRLIGGDAVVFLVRYSPDGRQLVAAMGQRVMLWDVANGAMRELEPRKGRILEARFSPDGAHLVVGSLEGDVGLWNLTTGTGRTLVGHAGAVNAIAFTRGNLVTGGADGTVRLWSLDGGQARTMLRVDGEANTVAADEQTVAVGSSTGVVHRWPLALFGEPLPVTPRELVRAFDAMTHARIDRNGRYEMQP